MKTFRKALEFLMAAILFFSFLILALIFRFGKQWGRRKNTIVDKQILEKRDTNKEESRLKRKTTEGKGDHGGDAVSNSVCNGDNIVDGALMCEILSWLSVKSLVRFKCVCKTWKALIEEDTYFIDLHLTRSKTHPSLFIAYREQVKKAIDLMAADGYRYKFPYQTWLMIANLPGDTVKANIQTIKKLDSLRFNTILGPLNSLVCFVDEYKHHYAVCLYNVSTREVTPWILSNLLLEEQKYADIDIYRRASHHLGVDPNTNEHKVVCILNLMRKESNTCYNVCEVLTVGDNIWRRIDEEDVATRSKFFLGSISVNGSLYWIAYEHARKNIQHNCTYLMAFDVGSEKFREITIPNFVLDQAYADNYQYFSRSALLEVDGNVALARIQSDYTVNLWTFHNDNKNMNNTKDTGTESWTEITIVLPFLSDINRYLDFQRGAGLSDHIIFDYWEPVPNTRKCSVTHYSYNLKKKTLTTIDDICGAPSSYRDTIYPKIYTTFAESLLPVQKKITSTKSDKL